MACRRNQGHSRARCSDRGRSGRSFLHRLGHGDRSRHRTLTHPTLNMTCRCAPVAYLDHADASPATTTEHPLVYKNGNLGTSWKRWQEYVPRPLSCWPSRNSLRWALERAGLSVTPLVLLSKSGNLVGGRIAFVNMREPQIYGAVIRVQSGLQRCQPSFHAFVALLQSSK